MVQASLIRRQYITGLAADLNALLQTSLPKGLFAIGAISAIKGVAVRLEDKQTWHTVTPGSTKQDSTILQQLAAQGGTLEYEAAFNKVTVEWSGEDPTVRQLGLVSRLMGMYLDKMKETKPSLESGLMTIKSNLRSLIIEGPQPSKGMSASKHTSADPNSLGTLEVTIPMQDTIEDFQREGVRGGDTILVKDGLLGYYQPSVTDNSGNLVFAKPGGSGNTTHVNFLGYADGCERRALPLTSGKIMTLVYDMVLAPASTTDEQPEVDHHTFGITPGVLPIQPILADLIKQLVKPANDTNFVGYFCKHSYKHSQDEEDPSRAEVMDLDLKGEDLAMWTSLVSIPGTEVYIVPVMDVPLQTLMDDHLRENPSQEWNQENLSVFHEMMRNTHGDDPVPELEDQLKETGTVSLRLTGSSKTPGHSLGGTLVGSWNHVRYDKTVWLNEKAGAPEQTYFTKFSEHGVLIREFKGSLAIMARLVKT